MDPGNGILELWNEEYSILHSLFQVYKAIIQCKIHKALLTIISHDMTGHILKTAHDMTGHTLRTIS